MKEQTYQDDQKTADFIASVFKQWAKNILRHNRQVQVENDKFYQECKGMIEVAK